MANFPPPPGPLRVYILDDQPIFRDAVQRFLGDEPDILIVGVAGTRSDVYPALADACPDVILFDPGIRHDDLAERLAHIRRFSDQASLIVLTLEYSPDMPQTVIAAGADAFVSKERTVEDLRNAIVVAAVNRSGGPGAALH